MDHVLNGNLVPILQTAIGPVILISGIGLLLLTMTNRLGRVIDRARILSNQHPEDHPPIHQQVEILWRRAAILRASILLASSSALCAATLIIALFVTVLMRVELGWLIGGLFVAGMAALIGSLLLFIRDVNMSLEALRLEIRSHQS
ncbi:MAG: DUF2721 domain-containing protein [bacterium]|nr:DUF2721 domain-containing protein [bacterium]